MEKKILIAVDDSRHSINAVRYAVQMAGRVANLRFVLFHVQPIVSSFLQDEARKDARARKQLNQVVQANEAAANKTVAACRDEMINSGIDSDCIECVTRKRNIGFAKDIIEYALQKRYDAVVAGRRGLSRLEKLYAGSVTTNILEQSQVIPVWLVNGEVLQGDIVLAVDGSEACLRAVDHVSFILSGDSRMRLTLLHVTDIPGKDYQIATGGEPDPELAEIIARGDRACMEKFYPLALERFKTAGIDENRIRLETVKGRRRARKVILNFFEKGNFSTLVVGRRGINKAFFMGSISSYLTGKATRGALWIVP